MFRFCDSYDHYDTSRLNLKYTVFNSSDVSIISGGRTRNCLKVIAAGNTITGVQVALDNQATWVLGFAFYLANNGGIQFAIAVLLDGSSVQLDLSINISNQLVISRNGTMLITSTNALVGGTWNYIEWAATISSSCAANSNYVRVNGVAWATVAASSNTKATSNTSANNIFLGHNGNIYGGSSGAYFQYDDFYILDGTGSINNIPLGDVTVDAIYPAATANYTDFSFVGTSAFGAVNEEPPNDDTSYIFNNVVGDRESFTFGAPTYTIQTTFAVQIVTDYRKQGTGTRTASNFIRISGTNYDSTAQGVGTGYQFHIDASELNPGTSIQWTTSDITALESGIKIVS